MECTHSWSASQLAVHVTDIADGVAQAMNARRISAITRNVDSVDSFLISTEDNFPSFNEENSAIAAAEALNAIGSSFTGLIVLPPPDCAAPPSGPAWSRLSQSLTVSKASEERFFVPYFGDDDDDQDEATALADELGDIEVPPSSHEESSEAVLRQNVLEIVKSTAIIAGQDEKIREQGDNSDAEETYGERCIFLEEEEDEEDEEQRAEEEEDGGKNEHRHDLAWASAAAKWDRSWKRVAIHHAARSLPPKVWPLSRSILAKLLGISCDAVSKYLSNAIFRESIWFSKFVEDRQQSLHAAQAVRQIRGGPRPSTELILNSTSLEYFLCRQCFSYDCLRHGNDTAKPTKIPFDPTWKIPGSESAICKYLPLGGCYYPNQFEKNEHESKLPKIPGLGKLSSGMRTTYGDDFCRITKALSRILPGQMRDVTCADVGQYLVEECGPLPSVGTEPDRRMKHAKQTMKESILEGKRRDFEACHHEGPCTSANCQCAQHGTPCEKFCGCNHGRVSGDRLHARGDAFCPRAAKGCSCKTANACRTQLCDCFSNRRECDPDLCACMACPASEGGACCNASILLGEHHRVAVGRSRVHGWGVYSTGRIPKGELVGEYIGEAIFHDQAEQRGRVYDKFDRSFMLEMSADVTLDATRMGNKLRFCNHHDEPNMECRLVRVLGDIRVGFYALCDILPFEELFFDYGTQFKSKWKDTTKKKKTGRAAARKSGVMDLDSEAYRFYCM